MFILGTFYMHTSNPGSQKAVKWMLATCTQLILDHRKQYGGYFLHAHIQSWVTEGSSVGACYMHPANPGSQKAVWWVLVTCTQLILVTESSTADACYMHPANPGSQKAVQRMLATCTQLILDHRKQYNGCLLHAPS